MSISSKLQDLGFKLKSYSIGVYDCTCPFCSHKRKPENRNKKVCRVWIEDDMASYYCVHCGEKGYVLEEKVVNKKTKYIRPDVKVLNNLGEKAEQFFNNRGISIKTAKDMGVYVSRKFPKPMIAYPYFKGGKIVNVKYRGVEEKTFTQEKDAEPVFYNYDNCFGQKEIIIVEGECFLGETELLTEKGWLRFDEYNGENVAQVNNNLDCELVKPTAIIKKEFNGYLLHRKNRNVDILATPKHNIVYITNGIIKKKTFEDMPKSINGYIPTAVNFNGSGLDIKDDEIRLIIAISADGTIDKGSNTGHIRIAFKKKRKIERLEQILKSLCIKYIKTRQANGYTYLGFCYKKAVKVFPTDWLFKMTTKQRQLFLKEIVLWDGNKVPNRDMTEYSSKLYENALFVQTLCHLSGFNSSIIRRKNEYGSWFKVSMLWKKNHISWQQPTENKKIQYTGKVYCVSVPSGMILTRNNEKITVIGNCDVLAFREVGINNVVSIPSGSINKEMPPDQQSSKFDFLKNSQPLLDSCEKIILALDNDEAGQCMTKALIDRLGMAKCYTVDWSVYNVQGKDANDFLKADRNILQDAINNSKPVPIRGILRINDDVEGFEDYLIKGINNAISTGYDNLDRLIKFYYGNFITITGYPSSGKSNFALNLIFNLAQKSSIKTLLCSFENTPNQLKKRLAQIIIGKPTINASQEILEEIRPHYDWLNEYFYILQDYTTTLNVDNIIEITEQAILKYGIKCVILDPLNKIEYTKTNNQTEDIGSLLNKLINFAKRYNILMFLVAHPTKPAERKLGTQNTPSGFDIAGSANFLNMSDVILTVHRKQDEQGNKSKSTRILVSKVRDNDYGHEGSCYFKFEPYTGHYTAIRKIDFENEKLENNERDF